MSNADNPTVLFPSASLLPASAPFTDGLYVDEHGHYYRPLIGPSATWVLENHCELTRLRSEVARLLAEKSNGRITEAQIAAVQKWSRTANSVGEDNARLRWVLQQIAEQEIHEIALDPNWPQRIARAALEVQV
jgi:hypothetical protein